MSDDWEALWQVLIFIGGCCTIAFLTSTAYAWLNRKKRNR